jgi:HEPN domain-containing protein
MIKKATQEWIDYAEENFRVALRENRHVKYPAHMTVCFNAQQCVEKYLKAFLMQHEIRIPRTHELGEVCRQCATVDSSLRSLPPL